MRFFSPQFKELVSFSSCRLMNLALEFPNTVTFNMPRGKDSSCVQLLLKQVRSMNFLFSVRQTVSTGCPTAIFFSSILHGETTQLLHMTKREVSYLDSLNFFCRRYSRFLQIFYKMYVTANSFKDLLRKKQHHKVHPCKEYFQS